MVETAPGLWIRDLSIEPSLRLEPACSAATIQDFSERLGQPAVDWAVRTSAEVADIAIAAMPRLGEGPGEQVALRIGVEAGTLCILASVLRGSLFDPSGTPEASQSAREFVHRGVSLPDVWASVRRTHRDLTDRLITACTRIVEPDDQTVEIRNLIQMGFEFVDLLVEDLGQAYTEESERWIASEAAARAEIVGNLIADEDVDLDVAERTLRYQIRYRHHLAIVVSCGARASNVSLEKIAVRCLEAAGASQILLIPHGSSQVRAWGNRTTSFPETSPAPITLDSAGTENVYVAVGTPGSGVDGFREAHDGARLSHRVVEIRGAGPSGVVEFRDVNLLALLLEDEQHARRFMLRELGELADPDPRVSDLRRTLKDYLETRSPQATAARLFVVRNTVAYRLARAAELLGRPVTERQPELWAALILAEALIPAPGPVD